MPEQPTGELDPLLPADFRPAFVAGQVQHQVARQARQVPQAGIRAAQIRDRPCLARRREENRPGLAFADRLGEQLAELPADRNATGLPGLAGRLVLLQDDRIWRPVDGRELG